MGERITALQDNLLDMWSNYDFKPKFTSLMPPIQLPQWIDDEDVRRLRSYAMLEAYTRNKSRLWLKASSMDEGGTINSDRREYGDTSLLVKTAVSSLIGNEWRIVVDDAVSEGGRLSDRAKSVQNELEEWSEKELLGLKILESEYQSVKFGDSVYVLGWDEDLGRPALQVYDPGFYFPTFNSREGGSNYFPEEVVIAWDFEEEINPDNPDDDRTEPFVRRIVWTLVDREGEYDTGYGVSTNVDCQYSDEIWTLDQAANDFRGQPHEYLTEPRLLNIDFIPVVHVPNTVSLQAHFGESVLADILQIVDDIQATDTDLQAAAATTGTPPIAITGHGNEDQVSYGPGTLLRTGDGNATLIDTSRSLDALLKLKDALLERVAVNSRTPESLLGRVKPNEVPSGIALTLSFTPHSGMIKEMRMVRTWKYSLLLKFVQRMLMQKGLLNEVLPAYIIFGSFLPADRQESMTMVVQLLSSKAISLETAVEILIEAGYPVDDITREISRIEMRDYEAAQSVMTITGNPELAAARLGYTPGDVSPDFLGMEGEDETFSEEE